MSKSPLAEAAKWAFDLMHKPFVILDTETTGLSLNAQIIQLSLLSSNGQVLLDSLVSPTIPIERGATAIHQITNDMVASAPSIDALLLPLLKALGDKDLVIYNADFDLRLLRQSFRTKGIYFAFPTSDRRQCRITPGGGSIHCAMKWYSQFIGDWNDYHNDYKWQKLPGGDHSALGDCRATLSIIREMAENYQPTDPIAGF